MVKQEGPDKLVEENPWAEMPAPDAALKRLEPLIGTWELSGRTLDSSFDNLKGRTTFEWLPGGFFLQQRFEMDFAGLKIHSLELIAYDPSTDTFASNVYSNLFGQPIPYRWDVRGKVVRIELEGLARFEGSRHDDGDSFSGGWRPLPGKEGPGNVAYDVLGRRVRG